MSSFLPGVAGLAESPDGTGAPAELSTFFFRTFSAFASSEVIAVETSGRPRLTSCLVCFERCLPKDIDSVSVDDDVSCSSGVPPKISYTPLSRSSPPRGTDSGASA